MLSNFASRFDDNSGNYLDDVQVDVMHLDVGDYFKHPEQKIDHLIGDGHVRKE